MVNGFAAVYTKIESSAAAADAKSESRSAATEANIKTELANYKAENDSRFSRIEADIARLQTDGRWTRWLLTSVVLGVAYMIIRDLLSG